MTTAQAIEELQRCAGSHFDLQVVAVLGQVLAEQTDARLDTGPDARRVTSPASSQRPAR